MRSAVLALLAEILNRWLGNKLQADFNGIYFQVRVVISDRGVPVAYPRQEHFMPISYPVTRFKQPSMLATTGFF